MTFEPIVLSQDAPVKLLVRDIRNVSKNNSQISYPWKIHCSSINGVNQSLDIQFNQIWLQGWVKTCDNEDNILICDCSGEVRVTKCIRSPGYNWIKQGAYCGVLATMKYPSQLPPEVEALKFMHISDEKSEAERIWPLEVEELMNLFRGRISFNL